MLSTWLVVQFRKAFPFGASLLYMVYVKNYLFLKNYIALEGAVCSTWYMYLVLLAALVLEGVTGKPRRYT